MGRHGNPDVCIYAGPELARYAFGDEHPFGPGRHDAFVAELKRLGLDKQASIRSPVQASREEIERFHTPDYVTRVRALSQAGTGYLDQGDTPAFPGVYEAARTVVGSVLDALERMMAGGCRRAFVPIAGLHHARRDAAAGFCVFNDCGIAIATLHEQYGCARIAYVDIDAHHGDGVFYGFEAAPWLFFVDLHQDGRTLYPGTGAAVETGLGKARGTKLNIPLPPGAGDEAFAREWARAEDFLQRAAPDFILFQCGADSIAGDPITQLAYSPASHRLAAHSLCAIADAHAGGRLLALGGGGYNLTNLARGWCAVVDELVKCTARA